MNARKWTITTLLALGVLLTALILIVDVVIDPYGEFRLINTDFNKLKLKAEKTTALQVASKLEQGKYDLVFGSSRTMLLSSEFMGRPVLNFSTSIYNNPGDVLAFLKTLNKKQIANINHSYFLIDLNGFHYKGSVPELSDKSSLVLQTLRNLGPQKIMDSWECLFGNRQSPLLGSSQNYIDEFGVLHKPDTKYTERIPVFNSNFATPYYLQSLRGINSFCRQYNIQATFFTIPWAIPHHGRQEIKLNRIFQQAADSCGGIYRFDKNKGYLNELEKFADSSHLNNKGMAVFADELIKSNAYYQKNQNEKPAPNINWSEVNENNFTRLALDYLSENHYTVLTDELDQAGRLDLSLKLYANSDIFSINKKNYIGDCFLLSQIAPLKNLLKNGLRFNSQEIMDNALQKAIMSGQVDMVKNAILLGADVNKTDGLGYTPLMTAVKFSPTENILRILLDCGANADFIGKNPKSEVFNETAFSLALKSPGPDTFSFLVKNTPESDAKRYSKLLNALNSNPQQFTKYRELTKLHKKLHQGLGALFARLQSLPLPKEAISKLNGKTILKLDGKTYELTDTELFFINNFSCLTNLGSLLVKAFHQNSETDTVAVEKMDKATYDKLAGQLNRVIDILTQQNLIVIIR